MKRMSINATTFDDTTLRNKYLSDNCIEGVFLAREGFWRVYEGKADHCGLLAGEFDRKRDAIAFIHEWQRITHLPRFSDCC